ncbi:M14 family metallopeptidase [Cohnella fermenti]|uniref:LysM peptidoglycan-binding domain-containing protein n=1 Tax=Cohnella fermenti TaxID=2565925 RepID=A0A4V3WFE6_9BACL|nr:M14 family metallopeptidase [Cohnella fermenti]THF79915.1 LysM peptidoglycan-binding domain-containing protein [Cohnella fermenti]
MEPSTYVVRQGDTPRRIASRFGISLFALAAANPHLSLEEGLLPGELLAVPEAPPRRYVVQEGDSWESIALKIGCSSARLRELNAGVRQLVPDGMCVLELPPATERIVRSDAEYGSAQLARDIEKLRREYPFLVAATIGRSVLGKPIHALRLGDGPFRLQANGAVHANEWITSLVLMRFAEDYARACKRRGLVAGRPASELFGGCTLWLVPMVNPDGADLAQEDLRESHPMYKELLRWNGGSRRFSRWKANARGVDLNDQFPAHWEEERKRRGTGGPGPRDYSGPSPLSEPESRALAAFTEETDFQAVLSLHTQGEEIYWNYRGLEPPRSKAWAEKLGEASGYRPVHLEGSDAGFKDWFIQKFRRPGFTIELGWGRNPLPLDCLRDIYPETAALLVTAMELGMKEEEDGS